MATGHGPFQAAAKALPAKLEIPGNYTTRALPSKVPQRTAASSATGRRAVATATPWSVIPAKVADDVLDEVISALRDYGLVVSTKGVVDRGQGRRRAPPASPRSAPFRLRPSQG